MSLHYNLYGICLNLLKQINKAVIMHMSRILLNSSSYYKSNLKIPK